MPKNLPLALLIIRLSAGVIGSLPSLLFGFTNYPQNLLWTSVPTLGALIALYLMCEHDIFTLDGYRQRRKGV